MIEIRQKAPATIRESGECSRSFCIDRKASVEMWGEPIRFGYRLRKEAVYLIVIA